jgi:hypothetical protein
MDTIPQDGTTWKDAKIKDEFIVGGLADDEQKEAFVSQEFVHVQEDIWNGIFDSAEPLVKSRDGKYRSGNQGKKMDYMPGNPDAIPSLNLEGYLLLKKMALKGIMDGIHMYRRQTQLGKDYSPENAIRLLGDWFKHANDDNKGTIDNTLLRALVRLKV